MVSVEALVKSLTFSCCEQLIQKIKKRSSRSARIGSSYLLLARDCGSSTFQSVPSAARRRALTPKP